MSDYKIYLGADDAWSGFQRRKDGIGNSVIILAENFDEDARVYLCQRDGNPEILVYVGDDEKFKGVYYDEETLRDDLIYIYDLWIEIREPDFYSCEEDYDGAYTTYESEEDFDDDEEDDDCEYYVAERIDEGVAEEYDPGEIYFNAFDLVESMYPDFKIFNQEKQEEIIDEILLSVEEVLHTYVNLGIY